MYSNITQICNCCLILANYHHRVKPENNIDSIQVIFLIPYMFFISFHFQKIACYRDATAVDPHNKHSPGTVCRSNSLQTPLFSQHVFIKRKRQMLNLKAVVSLLPSHFNCPYHPCMVCLSFIWLVFMVM